MKVKVTAFDRNDKKALSQLRAHTIKRIQAYIKSHPKSNVLDLALKGDRPVTTMQFISDNTICMNCGHVEEKTSYVIAQRAMGHSVTFTCDCGNKFEV